MTLLGRANWWLPRWLDRVLPRIDAEGTLPPSAAEAGDAQGDPEAIGAARAEVRGG
jgi:RND superfamily putative drug exporter